MDKRTTEQIERLLNRLGNSDLYYLLSMVEKEIRLSNNAISQGFEKNR